MDFYLESLKKPDKNQFISLRVIGERFPALDRPFRNTTIIMHTIAPSSTRSAGSMAVSALATLALAISPASAATLYSDDFSGGSGDLNGSTPDVTTGGAAWMAASVFNLDGSTEQGAGSATLAFTPADGFVYTLDASYIGLSANVGDTDWFGAGFVNGQSTGATANERFISGNVVGTAWMFTRGDTSLTSNTAFLGTGQLGTGNNGLGPGGVNNGVAWSLPTSGTEVDMRVVLDTTGGLGTWAATWYAKRPADSSYTVVRPTETLFPGTTITAVGVARSNPGVNGTVESFSLTSVVPEPASAALLGLGGLALLHRRRK